MLTDDEKAEILRLAAMLYRVPFPVNVVRLLREALAGEAALKDFCRERGERFPGTSETLLAFVKRDPDLALLSPSVRVKLRNFRFFAEHPSESLSVGSPRDEERLIRYYVGTQELPVPAAVAGLTERRDESEAAEVLRKIGKAFGATRPRLRMAREAERRSFEWIEREAARRKRESGVPLTKTRLELAREAFKWPDSDAAVLSRYGANLRAWRARERRRGEK